MRRALPFLVLLSALQLVATAAHACGPAAGGDPGCAAAGNPINVITGNKYQREVDLPALPGELGVELVRHYNSRYANMVGILGFGWKLSYEAKLHLVGDTVQIIAPDGRRATFSRRPDDPSRCAPLDAESGTLRIERDAHGRERFLWTESGETPRTWAFDADGKPDSLTAPSGRFVSFQYGPRGELLSITDPQGRSLKLLYGTEGFRGVVAIDTPVGRFAYGHDTREASDAPRSVFGNLTRVTAPDGTERRYLYEPERQSGQPHHLTGIAVPAPKGPPLRIGTYAYNREGKAVLSVRGPPESQADRVSVEYREPALPGGLARGKTGLTVLTNGLGQRTAYRYAIVADQYRVLEVRGAGCSTCTEANVRYAWTPEGRVRAMMKLSEAGRVLWAERYAYDDRERLIDIVRADAKGERKVLHFEYEGDRTRPTLIAQPSVVPGREHRVRIRYGDTPSTRHLPVAMTEEGYAPDPDGRASPQALTRSVAFRYGEHGALAAIDGPQPGPSDTVRFLRDEQGRLTRLIYPAPRLEERLDYDAVGRLQRHTPADAVPVELDWDYAGRLLGVRRAGQALRVAFDLVGRVSKLQVTPGEAIEVERQPAHERISASTGWFQQMDLRDDRLSITTGTPRSARTTQWLLDALGRPTERRDPDGGVTMMRNVANGIEIEDPLGRVVRAVTGTQAIEAQLRDPAAKLLARFHDRRAITERARSGRQGRQWRDDFGRVIAEERPAGGRARYAYDASDRLIERTDADGGRIRYRYDDAGRLRLREVMGQEPGASVTTRFEYFGAYRIAVLHPNQTIEDRYDPQGRLATRRTVQFGHPTVQHYQYDAQGQLASQTLPDGSTLQYDYDRHGRVTSLSLRTPDGWRTQHILRVSGYDAHQATTLEFGNGGSRREERDHIGRLARLVHTSGAGAALIDWRYHFDLAGRLTHHEDRAAGTEKRYAYDALDRLIVAETDLLAPRIVPVSTATGPRPLPSATERFAFDAAGDLVLRQTTSRHTEAVHYPPFLARPDRWDGQPLHHDAAGRIIRHGDLRFRYGIEGRLAEVTQAGRVLQINRHNAFGERIERRTARDTTRYLYSGGRVLAELDATGGIRRQYLYLHGTPIGVLTCEPACEAPAPHAPAAPLASIRNLLTRLAHVLGIGPTRRLYALHTDHLGAVHAATDQDGRLAWRADYDALGRATIRTATLRLDLRLAGQIADDATGLHDNYLRTYDPAMGRYLEPDPLDWSGDANPYLYAGGRYTQANDPLGLVLFAFDGTGNSDRPAPDGFSNVYKLAKYSLDPHAYYITGPGTYDERSGIGPAGWDPGGALDMGRAYTGKRRIAYMLARFDDYVSRTTDSVVTLDVIGFSRGAAEARDFVNRIAGRLREGEYEVVSGSGVSVKKCVTLRFMGLWDTVLGEHMGDYELSIPKAVKFVAHAVAVNEHRFYFPGESIYETPSRTDGDGVRVELGFVGAHSDVGGGYGEGDLSDVALVWMYQQAEMAGLSLLKLRHDDAVVTDPIWHDSNTHSGRPGFKYSGDRAFRYGSGESYMERYAPHFGLTYAASRPFLHQYSRPGKDSRGDLTLRGTVDIAEYSKWLRSHYGVDVEY